mmetsp:Transcript_39325/g.29042  ORF Transcript_39325/g.29042 Transcript_39325/m.29042 type:complete len:117 (-) Transcript_39325:136-486(-)
MFKVNEDESRNLSGLPQSDECSQLEKMSKYRNEASIDEASIMQKNNVMIPMMNESQSKHFMREALRGIFEEEEKEAVDSENRIIIFDHQVQRTSKDKALASSNRYNDDSKRDYNSG